MATLANTNKKVTTLLPAVMVDMGGLPIKQPLPTMNVEQVDPFLLLHHGSFHMPKNRPVKTLGVGPHPHRGFSPVTFVIQGSVHHRDSRGNNQIAKAGDVQWMHAGAGIVHSERPSQEAVAAGRQEIIQLWINSPAKSKMLPPDYQYLAANTMPVLESEDGVTLSRLVAGSYDGLKSPIRTQSDLLIFWGTAKAHSEGTVSYTIPAGYSATLYTIHGTLKVNGYGMVEPENLAIFEENDSESSINLTIPSNEDEVQFLILAGKPIGEKVVSHGPFVMNSSTEIMEAMRDYQMGKMGVLIEE